MYLAVYHAHKSVVPDKGNINVALLIFHLICTKQIRCYFKTTHFKSIERALELLHLAFKKS